MLRPVVEADTLAENSESALAEERFGAADSVAELARYT
jgi:hypothetical protein